MKNTTQQPLRWKWTGPIYKGEIPFSLKGLILFIGSIHLITAIDTARIDPLY